MCINLPVEHFQTCLLLIDFFLTYSRPDQRINKFKYYVLSGILYRVVSGIFLKLTKFGF